MLGESEAVKDNTSSGTKEPFDHVKRKYDAIVKKEKISEVLFFCYEKAENTRSYTNVCE